MALGTAELLRFHILLKPSMELGGKLQVHYSIGRRAGERPLATIITSGSARILEIFSLSNFRYCPLYLYLKGGLVLSPLEFTAANAYEKRYAGSIEMN